MPKTTYSAVTGETSENTIHTYIYFCDLNSTPRDGLAAWGVLGSPGLGVGRDGHRYYYYPAFQVRKGRLSGPPGVRRVGCSLDLNPDLTVLVQPPPHQGLHGVPPTDVPSSRHLPQLGPGDHTTGHRTARELSSLWITPGLAGRGVVCGRAVCGFGALRLPNPWACTPPSHTRGD